MPFQPQDEQQDLPNPNECMNVETSQYSQNIIQNSAPPFIFSSVTNIVNGQSSVPSSSKNDLTFNNEDPNGIEKHLSTPFDIDDRIDKILNGEEFDDADLPCGDPNDWLTKELALMALENIDESIQDRTMSVETQPPTDIRRRYQSDGKRQIEKSRSKPMAIKLPNLSNCQLNSNETFWLQLILITCKEKPPNKEYIHVDKLEYHADNLPECDHGFVRIPLTQIDIQKGIKQLARISIVKSKLDTYTFQLIPFNPLSIDNQIDIYENTSTKSVVAKAKCFRDAYYLKYSRIACQLLIKQDTTWHTTNIVCETSIMEEKEKQKNPQKASKRSASCYSSDEDEYPIHHRSSPKKRKRSPLLQKGLPVTRVKKS